MHYETLKTHWRSITSRDKVRIAVGCNCEERGVPERPDATQIPETHPSERGTCVISNSRSRGARIQMGAETSARGGGAQKCIAARRGGGGGRLQCYRTVERGIAESRDGGKDEGEEGREERQGRSERTSATTALRGVCVAWVETAPRSPTGRIIIPTHTYVHSGARSGA